MVSSVRSVILTALFLVGLLSMASIALAVPVTIDQVKVNGDVVSPGGTEVRSLDRDNEFDVKVFLTALADADNVQVEVMMRGYDHNDLIEDISDVFDLEEGVTYVKTLHITLPKRMEAQDQYWLRVLVTDRNSDLVQENYVIYVNTDRHDVEIRDVIFSPENEVKAGRALLATVRIKNYGKTDEENIKVSVSIPDLGVSASDYIDELDAGDSISSEELYLRIPMCVETGTYDVKVEAEYDDGDEVTTKTESIRVVQDETCGAKEEKPSEQTEKTFITAPGSQDVVKGTTGAVYPVLITNAGSQAKTYALSVSGVESWGAYRIEPSAVLVVPAGKTETAYVYVTANEDAPEGEAAFFVEVSSGSDKKMLPLTANVVKGEETEAGASSWDKVKRGLEVGLVVLVVLLVILGLIIGFNKLKGDEGSGEEDMSQTYY
ncbi:hypothetical protein D6764_01770 [Candidatus Woesearchaeota archaeon]|nr:MAG: hypothetical protein D6764_01770 [Candidatus Woesearchaeota archaeon]